MVTNRRSSQRWWLLCVCGLTALTGCGGGTGADGGMDVSSDVGSDAGADVARPDAASDAGADAASDAGTDAASDAGADAASDAGADAATEAGMDGGTCGPMPTEGCVTGGGGGRCGDVVVPMVCGGTRWACPAGTVPLSQCACAGRPPGAACFCTAMGWSCPDAG